MVGNLVGFSTFYSAENPPSAIIDAVASGKVDVAIVWGPAAGYLGAIGGRLHAVRSQAAPRLANTLAGPSLVRGTTRTEGQPRIITDTNQAVHGSFLPARQRGVLSLKTTSSTTAPHR